LTKEPGPIGPSELQYLLLMLKQKTQDEDNDLFLLKSFLILVATMKHLLSEMSLAQRFA
jgi:hypothetical protein